MRQLERETVLRKLGHRGAEPLKLTSREGLIRFFAGREVAVHPLHFNMAMLPGAPHEPNRIFWLYAQPAHAGVDLQMHSGRASAEGCRTIQAGQDRVVVHGLCQAGVRHGSGLRREDGSENKYRRVRETLPKRNAFLR